MHAFIILVVPGLVAASLTTQDDRLDFSFRTVDGWPAGSTSSGANEFRPPAIPLLTFAPMHQTFLFDEWALNNQSVLYWTGDKMEMNILLRLDPFKLTFRLMGNSSSAQTEPANEFYRGKITQVALPQCLATTTTIFYRVEIHDLQNGGALLQFDVQLRFVNLMLTEDLHLLSSPVGFIEAWVQAVYPSTQPHLNQTVATLYVDVDSSNCLHLQGDANVTWSANPNYGQNADTIRMGNEKQNVLGSFGDYFMLDWGYQYLSVPHSASGSTTSSLVGGRGRSIQDNFIMNGAPLVPPADGMYRAATNQNDTNPPVLAAAVAGSFGSIPPHAAPGVILRVMFGYDEIKVHFYYNYTFKALWKEQFSNATSDEESMYMLLDSLAVQADALITKCEALDVQLYVDLQAHLGVHYARVASMAYRQTLASVQLVAKNESATSRVGQGNQYWAFLKEISTGGDINTMDVIFPASPHFLFYAPEILKRLLLPVLNFAANWTDIPYNATWSPHQLGFYPISNATFSTQEPMPLEETGNMFLMIAKYLQVTNGTDLWFRPFYPMMKQWAYWLVETQLPVPPFQLCTDDFTGPMVGNANLAAKGVVALQAFAVICEAMEDDGCFEFELIGQEFAQEYLSMTLTDYPARHTTLTMNSSAETWSTKYNLLWQKLLGFQDKPFQDIQSLLTAELAFYKRNSSAFGWPLDDRFKFQKLDWMTWACSFTTSKTEFVTDFDLLYRMLNQTTSRIPMTDLFFVANGKDCFSFRSRAVVGALFAPMMLSFT